MRPAFGRVAYKIPGWFPPYGSPAQGRSALSTPWPRSPLKGLWPPSVRSVRSPRTATVGLALGPSAAPRGGASLGDRRGAPRDRAGGSLRFTRPPSDAPRRSSRWPRWPTACTAFAIGNASLADCGRRLVLRKRSALPRTTPFRHAGLNSILAGGLRPKTRSGLRPFRAVRLPLRGA